jgi:peptidoglycan/LPS O-acetylase OafA/YrhL
MPDSQRFHAFDALRAAMMLLGVFLHSATAYSTLPDVWWLKDPQTSRWADLFILLLHTFRLPVFFVMSGFFAALLIERRGRLAFLENRAARLALPFVLGMLAMFPFLKTASVYCHFLTRDPQPWNQTLAWLARGRLSETLEPMHLWFLQILLWLCLAAAAFAPNLNRLLGAPWFARLLKTPAALLAWSVPTFLTLLLTPAGLLDTPQSFSLHVHVIAAYAVFFSFGYGLYLHSDALPRFPRLHPAFTLLSLPAVFLVAGAIDRLLAVRPARDYLALATSAALNALLAWLFIFALISLFLRRCGEPSPRARYLADSAYWLYLAHPPALVLIQIPLMLTPWPAPVKFILGVAFAFPVLFFTYDRWVRPTWLGALLNGRRYPRGVAQAAAPCYDVSCLCASPSSVSGSWALPTSKATSGFPASK